MENFIKYDKERNDCIQSVKQMIYNITNYPNIMKYVPSHERLSINKRVNEGYIGGGDDRETYLIIKINPQFLKQMVDNYCDSDSYVDDYCDSSDGDSYSDIDKINSDEYSDEIYESGESTFCHAENTHPTVTFELDSINVTNLNITNGYVKVLNIDGHDFCQCYRDYVTTNEFHDMCLKSAESFLNNNSIKIKLHSWLLYLKKCLKKNHSYFSIYLDYPEATILCICDVKCFDCIVEEELRKKYEDYNKVLSLT